MGTSPCDYRLLGGTRRASNANRFDMVSARCRDNDTSTRINSHQFVCLFSSPAHSCTAAPLNFDWKRKDRAFIPSSLVSGHKVRHLWCKLVVARFRVSSILTYSHQYFALSSSYYLLHLIGLVRAEKNSRNATMVRRNNQQKGGGGGGHGD